MTHATSRPVVLESSIAPLLTHRYSTCSSTQQTDIVRFYYRSPEDGRRANGAFLSSAASKLSASGFGNAAPDLIARSLGVPSAKVWMAEVGKGWCPRCSGDWKAPTDDEAEILNGRRECSDGPNSRYGRKAPLLGMLRILGGFVGDQEGEYVPSRKRRRATDIHDWGWS